VPHTPTDLSRAQTWNAQTYETNARFVSDLGADILAWLDPQAGERILDLGCGDGALTLKIAQRGASVLGVDASPSLVAKARELGIDAQLGDGQALRFSSEFDAVFSNAALHWMTRAEDVIGGVRKALRPQGRFVAEFGGHGNIAAVVTALRAVALYRKADPSLAAPWFYPTAEEYRSLLTDQGFEVERIQLISRPTHLPTGMRGWLQTFRQPFFDQFGDQKDVVLTEVCKLLAPALCDKAGNWTADYVRLKVKARLR
jgi:trans-aconitate methyltransferase